MQSCYLFCQNKNKTETEHIKILTTKEENDVFFPQTIGAGDQPKWSIWSGDPIILGRGPGCTEKFIQTLNIKWKKGVHQDNLHISIDLKILSIKDV